MISDIKDIINILLSIFGIRDSDRERTFKLLSQISTELDALANIWIEILDKIERNPTSYPVLSLRDYVLKQRGPFEALNRFLKEGKNLKVFSSLRTNAGNRFFETIQGAIEEKGELYVMVHNIVYLDELTLEGIKCYTDEEWAIKKRQLIRDSNVSDPTLRGPEKDILKFEKRMLRNWEDDNPQQARQEWDEKKKNDVLRKKYLHEFRLHVSNLAALSGEFRTQITMYYSKI